MYNYLLTFFEKRLTIIPPELTFCGLLPVLQTCLLNPFTSAHLEQELPLTLTVLLMVACEQALCLGKKNSEEREGKKGEKACRQTFEAAIKPSCHYPTEHLSVRSLSVNQFRA